MGQVATWRKFEEICGLLHDPRRYVEDVVFALARNSRDAGGRLQQTFLLQARRGISRIKWED